MKPTLLSEYRPPSHLIPRTDLIFDLGIDRTTVDCRLDIITNPRAGSASPGLVLNAEGLDIHELSIDGRRLGAGEYSYESNLLTIRDFPGQGGLLRCRHSIEPVKNLALDGLYVSDDLLCTQCEPEGFRRISCFLDRPDVLSKFTVRLRADKRRFPVLLSNGNLTGSETLEDGRAEVCWQDPHPKPCYLFALVAGDLDKREAVYKPHRSHPGSPDEITLSIYAKPRNIERASFALGALERAMRWDERRFSRFYDLERYMIVAVDDFNSGAMENKGLNIFNSSYILASEDSSTDEDYCTIDAVVAHEYFHNWTGNRVTCRDWFQLSLKEGLTVFRENLFMSEVFSSSMRIEGIRYLQSSQFAEDAGPTAHPVQPGSYHEISNFYTSTVYEKGAEIIAMIHLLIGRESFAKGLNDYFERFDGQAATIQDLVATLLEGSGLNDKGIIDMSMMNRWFVQKGTPQLSADFRFNEQDSSLVVDLRQSQPAVYRAAPAKAGGNGHSPDDSPDDQWRPVPIPVALSVIDGDNVNRPAVVDDKNFSSETHTYLLCGESAQVRIENVDERSIPVILENFSAPVALSASYTLEQLCRLASHSNDPYTRWQAIQVVALSEMSPGGIGLESAGGGDEAEQAEPAEPADGAELALPGIVAAICREGIDRIDSGPAAREHDLYLLSAFLSLPTERYMLSKITPADPGANRLRRRWHLRRILERNSSLFAELYEKCVHELKDSKYDRVASMGLRSLANTCLAYLCQDKDEAKLPLEQLRAQYHSGNMTLRMGALNAVNLTGAPLRDELIEHYHSTIGDNLQLKEKYLQILATTSFGATERIRALVEANAIDKFDIRNPNQVHSLLYGFCRQNPAALHAYEGSGYRLMADCIKIIDGFNPHLSARLAKVFSSCQFLVGPLKARIAEVLDEFGTADLSPPLNEIVMQTRRSFS